MQFLDSDWPANILAGVHFQTQENGLMSPDGVCAISLAWLGMRLQSWMYTVVLTCGVSVFGRLWITDWWITYMQDELYFKHLGKRLNGNYTKNKLQKGCTLSIGRKPEGISIDAQCNWSTYDKAC